MGAIGVVFSYCSRGFTSAQSGLSQKRSGMSSAGNSEVMLAIGTWWLRNNPCLYNNHDQIENKN